MNMARARKKCSECRRSKKKCLPVIRDFASGQRCVRCCQRGLPCEESRVFTRKARSAGSSVPAAAPNATAANLGHLRAQRPRLPETTFCRKVHSPSQDEADPRSVRHVHDSASSPPASSASSAGNNVSQPGRSRHQALLKRRIFLGKCGSVLEGIHGLQRSVGPYSILAEASSIARDQIFEVRNGLKNLAWCLATKYASLVVELVELAGLEDVDVARSIYLEILDEIHGVIKDRHLLAESRRIILVRLHAIYEKEGHPYAAERMLKHLSNSSFPIAASEEAAVSTQLAHSLINTSALIRGALDELKLSVEWSLPRESGVCFPPLQRALRANHNGAVRVLRQTETLLDELDMLGQNATIAAAATGKISLLGPAPRQANSRSTFRDILGLSPLFHATHHGDYPSFISLVEQGSSIFARHPSGVTLMSVAAMSRSIQIARYLLEAGICPNNLHDFRLSSPLHEAAKAGCLEMCHLLIEHGAWVNFKNLSDCLTPRQVITGVNAELIRDAMDAALLNPRNDFERHQRLEYARLHQVEEADHQRSSLAPYRVASFDLNPNFSSFGDTFPSVSLPVPDIINDQYGLSPWHQSGVEVVDFSVPLCDSPGPMTPRGMALSEELPNST